MRLVFLLLLAFFLSSCSTTYYVVRHAEKEAAPTTMVTSDVPLSAAGRQGAEALKTRLQPRGVQRIFTTNYNRTRATAEPLSRAAGVPLELYDPRDTAFVHQLKQIPKGKVLVVGHSNTIDDLVNQLTGRPLLSDLPETRYGDLFVVKKRGHHYTFRQEHFGP